jgi:electron-transferring-flavoprotein dehydrogenase
MTENVRTDREAMEYDVVVVGAGPSGLACAIRLKQINPELNVCVLEKGAEVGAHLISGAIFDPRALNELIPDWKEKGAPLQVEAKNDAFLFLTAKKSIKLPTPPQMHNKGNYIISLGMLGRWMASQAEALGVEIYPGFAAAEVVFNEDGSVKGVATGDMGIGKDGEKTSLYQPGMEIHAKQTVFAEGCHGSLTKFLIRHFGLRDESTPQTYGIGIKEVWEIAPEKHVEGTAIHTIGWPLDKMTYGGSFAYHAESNRVLLGYVIGLDYQNASLFPFAEMQRLKTHPYFANLLEGGKRVEYGARAIVEGGLQALPKLTFPGGVLVGDTAGFLNVPRIKGNHAAIKSGMLAADAIAALIANGQGNEAESYEKAFEKSWLYKELYKARNIRPGFKHGLWIGLINAAFQTFGGWMLPLTLKHHADYAALKKSIDLPKIDYPKPDNILTFDRLTSVRLSNTMHEEDQPAHLKLIDKDIPLDVNLPIYDEPAQRYCPAGVYEVVDDQAGKRFVINAQNCVHCKTCDIKDPSQNIIWTTPQGGGGPNYSQM